MMSLSAPRSFCSDRRGISAVEFALLLPLMVGLYLGGIEITDGLSAQRKVTLTAGALVNLTAQATTITNDDMTNIMNATAAVMYPYASSKMTAIITCLAVDADKKAIVKWSVPFPASGNAHTEGVELPGGVDPDLLVKPDGTVANPNLLLAEVSYAYTPIIGYTITGTINLSDRMYMAPRISPPSYGDGAAAKSCT